LVRATYNSDNYVKLYYSHVTDRWIFSKKTSGTAYTTTSTAQTFAADDFVVLAGTYGSDGVRLFVNGELQASPHADTSVLAANPATVYLDTDGYAKHDIVAGWSRQLSDAEMRRYSNNPDLIQFHNKTMTYTGSLTTSQIVTIDAHKGTVVKTSGTAKSNDMAAFSGAIPLLKPEADVLYIPTAIGTVMTSYDKRWL